MGKTYKHRHAPFMGAAVIALMVLLAATDRHIRESPGSEQQVMAILFYPSACLFIGLLTFRPKIVATESCLIVRNPLRTYQFTWGEIAGFSPEEFLVVRLANGRSVTCFAVTRARIARLLGRRGYAHEVAEDLERRRRAGGGDVHNT